MMMPEVDCVKAHSAWPLIGSPIMTLAKYWLKMKVVMTVKKGWLAQSKRAQLYWPRFEASLGAEVMPGQYAREPAAAIG